MVVGYSLDGTSRNRGKIEAAKPSIPLRCIEATLLFAAEHKTPTYWVNDKLVNPTYEVIL